MGTTVPAELEQTRARPAAEEVAGETELERGFRKWQEGADEQYKALRWQATALARAFDGWGTLQSAEDWVKVLKQAREDYRSGHFLIDRIGAEQYVDPVLMATLIHLRRQMVEDLGAERAHEMMLIDVAVLSYYHMLRINGWIGNLALHIESEFFVRESPTARFKKEYGSSAVEGLQVEGAIERLGQQLLPLLDRSSRMMIRALKAVRDLRQVPAPTVAIGQAGQVNVGTVQANHATPPGSATEGDSRTGRSAHE